MGKKQVCLRADSDNPVYEKSGSAYSILIAERVVPYWLESGFPHSLADYRREGIPTRPERDDSLTKERKE